VVAAGVPVNVTFVDAWNELMDRIREQTSAVA
jgi:flagellar capping protein FliD